MKPFSIILMLSFSLCASLCCPGEDDSPAVNYNVEKENLIRVEDNANSFNLNEQIIIETTIPNQVTTLDGITINISDLFYSDILEDSFLQHRLTLFKETGFGTLSKIAVTNADIEASEGNTQSFNDIIEIQSVYDSGTNTFRNKFSITLKESGTFYLSHSRFDFDDFRSIEISGGIYELGFVTITSNITNANSDGGYTFTVN